MKHLSLFSGIGGLDLAAEWAGFETVAFVERDPYCQRVLAKRWPGVPIISDVRLVPDALRYGRPPDHRGEPVPHQDRHGETHATGRQELEPWAAGGIGLVSGGFPCQPHSIAGKRKASRDERDLWPEFARVIRALRPRWVVGENVPGLFDSESGRFFGSILGDLAAMGYSAGWGVWGASDIGALHQRERIFIVAHADSDRPSQHGAAQRMGRLQVAREADFDGAPRDIERAAESSMGRAFDGVRGWLDGSYEHGIPRIAKEVPHRFERLQALGNAVLPQQAYPLFAEIAWYEMNRGTQEEGLPG